MIPDKRNSLLFMNQTSTLVINYMQSLLIDGDYAGENQVVNRDIGIERASITPDDNE